jgi:t-SNARE complex subunit (syntaxin)
MTDVWDGATYALTHHYRGGENTSRAQQLIDSANDFIYNPSLAVDQVEEQHMRMLVGQSEDSEAELREEGAAAQIADLSASVQQKADEFESRNEELRETLVAEAGGDDGGD